MKVITFYSYKGGVGRTLALANIAQRLANDFGKVVAVMDFDLEAPGLHHKFTPDFKSLKIKKGLVDYIYEFAVNNKIEPLIKPFSLQLPKERKEAKPIYIIPAGNTNQSEYWQKLAAISWHEMFYKPNSQGVNFILNLKKQIEKELNPDFLLIDSRTGITEISGITISLLADECVVVSVNNKENFTGSEQVINSIRSSENTFLKTPNVHFVLSRIPYSTNSDIRGREIKLKEYLRKRLNLSEVHVLHSDPNLEWEETIKIGNITHKDEVPIGLEYLSLFDAIIRPYLTEQDHEHFERIQKIKTLFELLYATDDRTEKLDLYGAILNIDNTNLDALEGRAEQNFKYKKYKEALNDFEKLGQRYFKEQVECLYHLERHEEALRLIDHLFKTSMKKESLYELKYKILDKSNSEKEVVDAFFEEWESSAEKTPEFYNSRANLSLDRKLYERAKDDAQKAINLNVKFSLGYATLAETYSALGNDEGFFTNLELAFIFDLKKEITDSLGIPVELYSKYRNNERFLNLLKQYNIEADFMKLLDSNNLIK